MSAFNTPIKAFTTGGFDSDSRRFAPSSASSTGSEVVGCASESPQASPIKSYPQVVYAAPIAEPPAPAAPTTESAADRVQRLVQQMKDKALNERIKQQQMKQQELDVDEDDAAALVAYEAALLSTPMLLPSSIATSTNNSNNTAKINVSSSSSSSSSSSTKPWHRAPSVAATPAAATSVATAVDLASNPNVIHMTASEFRDDDWSEIERRRSRASMFRAKSPSAVRRVLDRPAALPKREPRPSTVPVPFSFDSETASFEQLAEFRAPIPIFKSSEYHAEHAHELELVRKQGKGRFVAPKPLTVPESPALKTRERVELYNERHHDELPQEGADYDEPATGDLPRTISFDRVSTRDMPSRAAFKPQLTIPESPGLLTDERGEVRREQIMAREQAELEREERERIEQQEAAARALAHSSHHTHPQRRELTVPESPAFLTRDRANARRELFDSINEHRDPALDAFAAEHNAYDDRADVVRAPSFDQFLGRDIGAVARASFKQELTIPESPAFLTRDRAVARRQLQERLVDGMASSNENVDADESFDLDGVPTPPLNQLRHVAMTRAKPQLTVPESPLFATTDRSEVRREAAQREAERAAHAAELAKMEDDVRERSERLAARHYVAQRRALTVPESPALLTKMRGEVHAERFEALVLEEEARAEQLEAESRAPLRRVDNTNQAPRVHKPKPALTIPESPALLTKMRGTATGVENF